MATVRTCTDRHAGRPESGLAWNTTTSAGTFDWGTRINSTSVACNWVIGSTDYLKANDTADCPDTEAEYVMVVTLSPRGIYQADVAHNSVGDFSYAHVDCDTTPYDGAEVVKTGASHASGRVLPPRTAGRPTTRRSATPASPYDDLGRLVAVASGSAHRRRPRPTTPTTPSIAGPRPLDRLVATRQAAGGVSGLLEGSARRGGR
ncbi:MAG: hypothetical protein C4343_00650 [Chloroflexota bacterium]